MALRKRHRRVFALCEKHITLNAPQIYKKLRISRAYAYKNYVRARKNPVFPLPISNNLRTFARNIFCGIFPKTTYGYPQ